jgi:hypothetical protein
VNSLASAFSNGRSMAEVTGVNLLNCLNTVMYNSLALVGSRVAGFKEETAFRVT